MDSFFVYDKKNYLKKISYVLIKTYNNTIFCQLLTIGMYLDILIFHFCNILMNDQ
jgi:hypothetical protein